MPIDFPSWTASVVRTPLTGPRYAARPRPTTTKPHEAEVYAIKKQAETTSHNTFRPDVYRVSEGYLN